MFMVAVLVEIDFAASSLYNSKEVGVRKSFFHFRWYGFIKAYPLVAVYEKLQD